MRRLYLLVLLSIMICIALVTIVFAAPPVIDLPLDQDVDVRLTAGFGDVGHHDPGTPASHAIDIAVGQGTSIIAPFDGSVIYQRFAHGGYSIIDPTTGTEVPIGGRIPSSPFRKFV